MANGNINGVNVDQLFSTINAIKENPGLAKFKFRANNQWVNGGRIGAEALTGLRHRHQRRAG